MTVLIVILNVIKWIFIVIGFLAALVLVLTALVLFPAVRYDAAGRLSGDEFDTDVKIRALFRLVRVCYKPSENENVIIKILGIKLGRKKKKAKKQKVSDDEPPLKEKDSASEKKEHGNKSSFEKKKSSAKKVSVRDRIKSLKGLIGNGELVKLAINFAAEELKALKPKMFKVSGFVGFDSPDKTGYFIAVVSILKALTCFNIDIAGEFNEEKIDVEFAAKGKTSIFKMLWPLVKFVFKKPVWAIVKGKLRK